MGNLPDISVFQAQPSDRFLVDLDDFTSGHPFKGVNSTEPHGGAHINFDNSDKRWPRGGHEAANYPAIYAVADGVISRVDYRFGQRGGNDRYGLDLTFAIDAKGNECRLCYSIEPMIIGEPPDFSGENLTSPTGHKEGGGPEGRKASGLLMVDGVLYMWVRNLNKDGTGASLAWSNDHAKSWTWVDGSFPEIGYPTWLNAGRNYAAAEDKYVYCYSPDTPSAYKTTDHILLARVPLSEIRSKAAYRFFAGMNDEGEPKWTAAFDDRQPVFTDPGHCYRPEVVFNPGIGRYLLLTATSGAPQWCGTAEKYLGIFEATKPWGPWRMVKQIEGWGGEENRFQPRIPPAWISENGKTFYLLYSCFPKGPYQFNVLKCVLEISN